jgi:hypothetical protein
VGVTNDDPEEAMKHTKPYVVYTQGRKSPVAIVHADSIGEATTNAERVWGKCRVRALSALSGKAQRQAWRADGPAVVS